MRCALRAAPLRASHTANISYFFHQCVAVFDFTKSTKNQIQILNLGANIRQINQNFYKTLFKLDKIQTNNQTLKIGYLLLPKSGQNSAKIALLDKVEKACQKLK